MPDHPEYLAPSELGTKEYWESFYARTLSHLSTKSKPGATPTPTAPSYSPPSTSEDGSNEDEDVDDDSDPGTSWFSEHNAPGKVLDFLTSDTFPLAPCNTASAGKGDGKLSQPSILDLGTGNGSMLALMRKKGGFGGYCVGVDYSEGSIELARELQRLKIHSAYWADDSSEGGEGQDEDEDEDDVVVAGAEGLGTPNTAEAIPVTGDTDIRFEVWDVLASEGVGLERLDWFPDSGFDIVLDKGTFDAISLSEETVPGSESKERVCERYPAIAKRTVRKGGFLVVTSCNWTEEELIRWFTKDDDGVEVRVWGRVEYPRFRFGGMEGQGVCTVCFERV